MKIDVRPYWILLGFFIMWVFKQCTKCKEDKLLSEFKINKKTSFGVENNCKPCRTEYFKEYKKKNIDAFRVRWELDVVKKQERLENDIEYRKKSTEYNREYARNKRLTDIDFKRKDAFRSLIRSAFKRKGYKKNSKTFKVIGCDYDFLVSYIESKFKEGMSWDNYGEWHIDHIYPISLATDLDHMTKLNHYTNLQPLWKTENLSKGNKLLPLQ